MLSERSIAIVGLGTMGSALSHGLLRAAHRPRALCGTVRRAARVPELQRTFEFDVGTENGPRVRASDLILVCTKPARILGVLEELREEGALAHGPLVISIAAGVSLAKLERAAGEGTRLVRAMPNTPSLIGEGMTVLSPGSAATEADLEDARAVFQPLGRVRVLEEEHMDTVTGLAASGPAFVYVIVEALSEGGVMMGLPRQIATELAAQMMQGAARMVLETGKHPAALKDEVTTPAGCTISGLLSLEDGKIRSVLARGVQEAARAARALGEVD